MTFLRLLSFEARQNFTYTCVNGVAWQNAKTNKYDMSVRFLGDNESEFSHKAVRPHVLRDGCKGRSDKGETVFEFRTKRLNKVPVVDFMPVDYGGPNQAFGFSIGPVCFK